MSFELQRFAFIAAASVALCAAALGGQQTRAKSNPPADPPAKTIQPATHFTQGTIASIDADQIVIAKKVRGKAERVVFALNSQTQRSGNLVNGTRVSVQYRERDKQKIAAAVRELPAEAAEKREKTAYKPRSKS